MTDKQQKSWEKRKERAKYFYDISKLTFGASVLGEIVYIHNYDFNAYIVIVGSLATITFFLFAERTLKVN